MKSFILSIVLFLAVGTFAQSPVGTWLSIDDETKEKKSWVKIYKKDGKLYGKIIKLYRKANEDQDPVCTECTDDRKGKKIIGMNIIRGLSFDADSKRWESGTIMDPAKGKTYKAKLWVDEKDPAFLNVRGYAGIFYRTQKWVRIK